jgi:hypothetical protein
MTATKPQTMSEAVAHGVRLVEQLLAGSLGVDAFLRAFGDLYDEWAMDGHESDTAELELLASRSTAVEILGHVRSAIWNSFPEDAEEAAYLAAGRLPRRELLPKLRELVTQDALARAGFEVGAGTTSETSSDSGRGTDATGRPAK